MLTIMQGGPERGLLEKFADGCNYLGRAYWHGHQIQVVKGDLTVTGNGKTVTSHWMSIPSFLLENTKSIEVCATVPTAAIIALFYLISCIPVAAVTGVGLFAKQIALASDENAKRYNNIAKNYLIYSKKDQKSQKINKEIDKKNKQIKELTQKINEIDNDIKEIDKNNSTDDVLLNITSKIKEKRALSSNKKVAEEKVEKLKIKAETIQNDLSKIENKINEYISIYNKNIKTNEKILLIKPTE